MPLFKRRPFLRWPVINTIVCSVVLSSLTIGCDGGGNMTFIDYPDFAFSGGGQSFDQIWFGGDHRGFRIAEVYIRNNKGEVYNVQELRMEDLQKWVDEETDEFRRKEMTGKSSYSGMKVDLFRFPNRTLFFYHEGKLIACSFGPTDEGPFAGIEVGKSKDGEFLKLPASYDDLVRVFGKPEKTTKSTVGR